MTAFLKKNPSVDPGKEAAGTPEYDRKSANLNDMVYMANLFQKRNPTLTVEQAFGEAYSALPENRTKVLEKEREAGEIIGRAQVAASGVGAVGGVSGGSSKSTGGQTITLTASQKQHYDKILSRSGKAVADRFAKNVASK